jgi:hypothetical protein
VGSNLLCRVGGVAIIMTTETDTSPFNWNTNTLKEFLSASLNDFKVRVEEARKNDDLRYQQRFDASEKALQAASLAAKEAIAAAMVAAEKSVQAALAAAEKAIEKAEAAQHAHNVGQNEWRATVNDLTRTVAETARHESEALVAGLRANNDVSLKALDAKLDALGSRVDREQGISSGARESKEDAHLTIGSVVGIVGGVTGALSLIVMLLLGVVNLRPAQQPIPTVVSPAVVPVAPASR